MKIVIFLILNFLGLFLGSLATSSGVSSEWYSNLSQAPWTPPGWVFGSAWSFIMICFAFFMANWWNSEEDKRKVILLFSIQWILNVSWNPVFFAWHQTTIGLVIISTLWLIVGYLFFLKLKNSPGNALLVLPYFLWLAIATSLNAYIVFMN